MIAAAGNSEYGEPEGAGELVGLGHGWEPHWGGRPWRWVILGCFDCLRCSTYSVLLCPTRTNEFFAMIEVIW